MPICLPLGKENDWLNNSINIQEFAYPNFNPNLETLIV